LYSDTFPSKEAAPKMPGVRADHCTSKFQLEDAGISATTSPEDVSQHSVRLSFPHDSSREVSDGHQAMDRTPFVCAVNVRWGETAFRRSHTWSVNEDLVFSQKLSILGI
jgi:hypothetical protein